ncbi:outer dynein arm-docking complex subunit 4 [Anableps anableps]
MEEKKQNNEEEILKIKVTSLKADGEWKLRKKNYKQALCSFTAALDLSPKDKKCLVARSKCYMQMGQYVNALRDAEASLIEDASFPEGLYQKAEALYYIGEFEFALVFYHRGQKIRPQMEGFKLGIHRAEEAINNSVGSGSVVKPEIKGDLSFIQEEKERKEPIVIVQNLTKKEKQQPPVALKNEKATKQLLGEFYQHKDFLEKLLTDEDLVKGVTESGERVEDIIQSCITSLNRCADFWSQENLVSFKDRKHQPKQQRISEKVQFLLKSLDVIDRDLTSGNASSSLIKAEELMRAVQGWSKQDCPIKEEIVCLLHSCIGNAFFDLEDVDKALQHHHKDLKLANQCWEEKVPMVPEGLEKAWLLHEICCCYLELNYPEKARDYCLRSIAVAEEMFDKKLQLRARILLGLSELKLENFESSISHFGKALSLAKLQNDATAMSTIQEVLDEAKQRLPHNEDACKQPENID